MDEIKKPDTFKVPHIAPVSNTEEQKILTKFNIEKDKPEISNEIKAPDFLKGKKAIKVYRITEKRIHLVDEKGNQFIFFNSSIYDNTKIGDVFYI